MGLFRRESRQVTKSESGFIGGLGEIKLCLRYEDAGDGRFKTLLAANAA